MAFGWSPGDAEVWEDCRRRLVVAWSSPGRRLVAQRLVLNDEGLWVDGVTAAAGRSMRGLSTVLAIPMVC